MSVQFISRIYKKTWNICKFWFIFCFTKCYGDTASFIKKKKKKAFLQGYTTQQFCKDEGKRAHSHLS